MVAMLVFSAFFLAVNSSAAGDSATPKLFFGRDSDGQLEVFEVGQDGVLYHRWRKISTAHGQAGRVWAVRFIRALRQPPMLMGSCTFLPWTVSVAGFEK